MQNYRPDIDGVRALAVLLVMAYHAFPAKVPGGFIGVDLFFVISGYLITGTILRDLDAGRFSYLTFYARRVRRIVPALVVVVGGTLAIGVYVLLPIELAALGTHAAASAAFVNNVLLWLEAGYFDSGADTKPFLHLWSLGVEEQFYLLWPVLTVVIVRRGHAVRSMAILAVASFATNVAVVGGYPDAAFYLLPTRFWELLVGAMLVTWTRDRTDPTPVRQNLTACLGVSVVLAATAVIDPGRAFPGWWAVLPVAAATLLIASPGAWLNRVVLGSRPVVALGLISYPLYLWHWPLLSLARLAEGETPSRLVRVACLAAASVLAWATWAYVEVPIRRAVSLPAPSRVMRRYVAMAVLVLGCLGAVGVAVNTFDGFPAWFSRRHPGTVAAVEDLTAMPIPQKAYPPCAMTNPALGWCNTSSSAAATVAVLGDSHALYLFPGVARVFTARGIASMTLGHSACAPLWGVRSFVVGKVDACADATRAAVDRLSRDVAVRTVMLSSLGPYYFSGVSVASEHPASDTANRVLEAVDGDTSSREVLFERGYDATIAKLEEAGKLVVFVVDVPELPFHPSACVDTRPVRLTRARRGPCRLSRADVDRRQAVYRALIQRLVARHPRLRVFDTLPSVCDAAWCSPRQGGRLIYRDSNHLSVYGSTHLAEQLATWLMWGPDEMAGPRAVGP